MPLSLEPAPSISRQVPPRKKLRNKEDVPTFGRPLCIQRVVGRSDLPSVRHYLSSPNRNGRTWIVWIAGQLCRIDLSSAVQLGQIRIDSLVVFDDAADGARAISAHAADIVVGGGLWRGPAVVRHVIPKACVGR